MPKEEVESWMKANGIELFFETSSKTAENVRLAFEEVAKQLFHQRMSKTKAAISSAHIENMVSLEENAGKESKSNCCGK